MKLSLISPSFMSSYMLMLVITLTFMKIMVIKNKKISLFK